MKLTLIAGTNRPGSTTLQVTQTYQKIYQELGAETQIIDLQDMPLESFAGAAYSEKPEGLNKLTQAVLNADGLHVFTPEYNGGFPGVLKYFIDLLPFPESFENRPVAFTGLAAGMWGALRPVEQLEGVFKYRNAMIFNERVFLSRVGEAFKDGEFTADLTRDLVASQTKNFMSFVAKLKT